MKSNFMTGSGIVLRPQGGIGSVKPEGVFLAKKGSLVPGEAEENPPNRRKTVPGIHGSDDQGSCELFGACLCRCQGVIEAAAKHVHSS